MKINTRIIDRVLVSRLDNGKPVLRSSSGLQFFSWRVCPCAAPTVRGARNRRQAATGPSMRSTASSARTVTVRRWPAAWRRVYWTKSGRTVARMSTSRTASARDGPRRGCPPSRAHFRIVKCARSFSTSARCGRKRRPARPKHAASHRRMKSSGVRSTRFDSRPWSTISTHHGASSSCQTARCCLPSATGNYGRVVGGKLDPIVIGGLPPIWASPPAGGLMDVARHPDYASNGWPYLSSFHSYGSWPLSRLGSNFCGPLEARLGAPLPNRISGRAGCRAYALKNLSYEDKSEFKDVTPAWRRRRFRAPCANLRFFPSQRCFASTCRRCGG
jgi:hypothetical protein